MDIQRIVILLGLAVTSYLLILAWNDDYGSNIDPLEPTVIDETSNLSIPMDDLPEAVVSDDIPDVIPEAEVDAIRTDMPRKLSERHNILVRTDVLDITIDLQGGDIVRVALPSYPVALDTPNVPFCLLIRKTRMPLRVG